MLEEIKKVAIEEYPKEMVGYVKDNKFYKLENVSKDPTKRYSLSLKDTIFLNSKNIDALVHSHTIMDNNPSAADLAAKESTGFVFWIIGTNGKDTTDIKEVK